MTQLIHELRTSGGDYSSPSDYCAHIDGTDFTAASCLVFSHGGVTGSLSHGDSVTGQNSGATGVLVTNPTTSQILLDTIAGTFQSGEVVQASAGNSVTLSDAGNDCEPTLKCFAGTYAGRFYSLTATVHDANTTLRCEADDSAKHNGVFGSGVIFQDSGAETVKFQGGHCEIRDIELQCTANSQSGIELTAPVGVVIERILNQGAANVRFINQFSHVTQDLDNVIVRNCHSRGTTNIAAVTMTRGATLDNNLIEDGTVGITWGGTSSVLMRNNVVIGQTTSCYGGTTVTNASSNNAASDTTGTVAGSSAQNSITTAVFEDYANDDFRPANAGALYQNGIDPVDFDDDIRGIAHAANWDIGPYTSAAPVSTLSFDGSIADVSATGGQAYSQNTASDWSTNAPAVTYAETGTAWPAGIALNTATGEISGTPGPSDVGSSSGHTITATDSYGGVVASNAFDITVVAPAVTTYDPAHPADVTVNSGQQASFTPVVNSGATIVVHQWQVNIAGGGWNAIDPAESNASLSFNSQLSQNGYQYRRADVDEYSQITTSPDALLTVQQGNITLTVDRSIVEVRAFDTILNITAPGAREVSGSGAPSAQAATASGSGVIGRNVTGSGAPSAQPASSGGVAIRYRVIEGSGSSVAQSAQSSGMNHREIVGSGDSVAQPATSSGEKEFLSAKLVFGVKKEKGRV